MTGFAGFPPQTLAFLRGLKANNDRDWFAAHKAEYQRHVKEPAAEFCAAVSAGLGEMTGEAHVAKVYRIHRDLRFAKDKTPYNAHLHVSFAPADRDAAPMWFFGLDPDKLHLGCGVFAFDKTGLERFRAAVDGPEGAELARAIATATASGGRLSDPALKRVPAPYPADHPRAGLLRHKGLGIWAAAAAPERAQEPDIVEHVRAEFARLRPVRDWLDAL